MKSCHDGPCGGHFVDRRTSYKILLLGYYWHSLFKDAKEYVKRFDSCQRIGKLIPLDEMPLQPHVLVEPFEKWALDFIGPIKPTSKQKSLHTCLHKLCYKMGIFKFLFEYIFTHFGVPIEIVTNQGTQFTSKLVQKIMKQYKIKQ